MANSFEIMIKGQPFWGQETEREVKVYFSIPDDAVMENLGNPGVAIYVSGFGGSASSNVYKKMRNLYADKYNLVTISCDYLGTKFIEGKLVDEELNEFTNDVISKIQNKELLRLENTDHIYGKVSELYEKETPNDFAEMGVFQALDCINSIYEVISLLNNIGVNIDNDRIIGFGVSHGAYLLYLMNAFVPQLFSIIIDNSAWVVPTYFFYPRCKKSIFSIQTNEGIVKGECNLLQKFHAVDWIDDFFLYDLTYLYEKVRNQAKIYSFHGENDALVPLSHKRVLASVMNNFHLNIVSENNIDKSVFNSTDHGLNADFLKLFEFVMEQENGSIEYRDKSFSMNTIITRMYLYKLLEINHRIIISRENLQ